MRPSVGEALQVVPVKAFMEGRNNVQHKPIRLLHPFQQQVGEQKRPHHVCGEHHLMPARQDIRPVLDESSKLIEGGLQPPPYPEFDLSLASPNSNLSKGEAASNSKLIEGGLQPPPISRSQVTA